MSLNRKIGYQFLKSIADNIPVSINIFDLNGNRVYVNSTYYRFSGKKENSRVKEYFTLNGKGRNDYLNKKIINAIKKGKHSKVTNYLYKSSFKKNSRYLEIFIGPIFNENGSLIGANSIADDVTRRVLARKKMIQLKNTLEKKVAERTEKLLGINKKLKKISREKTVLVSNIAHEIKTILAIIRGNLDIMDFTERPKTPLEIECGIEIKRAISKMSKVVSDLVFLTRAELYADTFRLEKFDLVSLVAKEIKEYKTLMIKKKINVYLKKNKSKEIIINADKSKIVTLVGNLIENALKFGKEKGKLEISLRQDKNKTYMLFKDNGRGIEKEKIKNIFEPFYQAKESRERKIERRGFGLGLAICKKIVIAHGGIIQAESKGLNKGSLFLVTFPKIPGK